MLLRFGCSNYLSIKDFQEISLISKSAFKEQPESLLHSQHSQQNGLRVIAIYGANAAGKTNIVNSLLFMSRMVRSSHRSFLPDSDVPIQQFALNESSRSDHSHFECDFLESGIRYSYGFSIQNGKISKEFLYAFPNRVKQVWYSRDESIVGSGRFQFGRSLKGRNALISDLTRNNSLFLSAAAQQGHEQLKPVYQFFTKELHKGEAIGSDDQKTLVELLNSEKRDWLLKFVTNADFGIEEFKVETEEMSPAVIRVVSQMFSAVVQEEENEDNKKRASEAFEKLRTNPDFSKKINVSLGHRSSSGKPIFMPWESESEGTKRLFMIMAPVLKALESGGITIVDEIDASLHTLLVLKVIELYKSPSLNPKGAQLIFTTHDTNILCSEILRRDEIYFVEKNRGGESTVYSLADFPVRKDDNFEKGYLQGRFGAIPFIGDIEAIST